VPGWATRGRASPKALLQVGDEQPLRWTLSLFAKAGVSPVTVVVGHRAREIERAVADWAMPGAVRCVMNHAFAATDTAASFAAGAEIGRGPAVVTYADTMVAPLVLERLLAGRPPTASPSTRRARRGHARPVHDGRIVRIAKELTASTTDAESTGLFVLSGQAGPRLLSACRLRANQGQPALWLETVLDGLLGEFRLIAVPCEPHEWCEIAVPGDLPRAPMFARDLAASDAPRAEARR
jgi:choline kinase